MTALEAIDAEVEQRPRCGHRNHVLARHGKLASLRRKHTRILEFAQRKIQKCNSTQATRKRDLICLDPADTHRHRRVKRSVTGVKGKGAYKRWTSNAMIRTSFP